MADEYGHSEKASGGATRLGRTLALAGFVPFAVLAFWLYGIAPDHPWRQGTIVVLTAYGAVILSFLGGVRRAFSTFTAKDRLNAMRRSAMARSFSWDVSAACYDALYRKTIGPQASA